MLEDLDLNNIQNIQQARECIVMLLNLVENLKSDNRELREQVQRLRDEINHLKGEQGKPNIRPRKRKRTSSNHSSERERHEPKKWKKSRKLDRIKIDHVEVLDVETERLPADARFKSYEDTTVQDLDIRTNNILFRKKKYHSRSEGKTYLAELPRGYEGQFGPGLKSLAIVMSFGMQATEPKILEFFDNFGIQISSGQLSNILIKDKKVFHTEKDAVYEAGLRSSPWQHIDDTGARVNGQNQYCQIVCNPLYTAYFTTEKKSRLTVVDVLKNLSARTFLLNAEAFELLHLLKLPARVVRRLKRFPQDQELSEAEFTGLLDEHLPDLGPLQRSRALDAAAVAAYHAQLEFPVVRLVICDDAPQFKLVTEELALCWIHDGRHYKSSNSRFGLQLEI
ncbi:MAG: transposase [Anaerolineae bacterium]|nr:transposase [Anaerolineae bacterium]